MHCARSGTLVRSLAALWFVHAGWLAAHAHARPPHAKHAAQPSAASDKTSPAPAAEPAPAPAPEPQPAQQTQPEKPADGDKPSAGSATGAADFPQPSAAVSSPPDAATVAADEKLAALRADVTALMDDMVQARSRAAMLGKTLFKTQLRVYVQNLAAPDPVLVKLVLKLDGAPIYHGDASSLSGDDVHQTFEGPIAPGAHVLSADIEQRSRDDDKYGYALHQTYHFQARREKRSELTLILDDDSDLASDFPDDGAGEYDVRTKLRVRTKDLNEK